MAKKTETKTDAKKTSTQLAKELEMPETVVVSIGEQKLIGTLREFATGSKGYFYSGKVVVGEKKCQVGGNIVIVGSKE